MKIKLKESELREFIRDEILKEARMSKRRMSGERIQIKGCDFKDTLRGFKTDKNVPVFTDKQIMGLNRSLSFGIPVGGCEVIKLGLFGLAALLGFNSSDSKADVKAIDIKDYKNKAIEETELVNDDFSKVTHIHFPNTMDAIYNQKPSAVILRNMELDKNSLRDNLILLDELLSEDISSLDRYLKIIEAISKIFKFNNLSEYQSLYAVSNNETRETLQKLKPEVRSSTIKTAYNKLADQDIQGMLRNDLKIVYDDLESNSENNADLKNSFNEIKPFFIRNSLD